MLKNKIILIILIACLLTSCSIEQASNITEIEEEKTVAYVDDLEELREYRNEVIRERFKNEKIVISAVGDIMLGRGVGNLLKSKGLDLAYKNFKEDFDKTDILFGNLESPITNGGKRLPGKKICLRANTNMIEILKSSGFDIVSLANNHILDYDTEGLMDTFDILDKNNIAYTGAGINIAEARKPYIISIKNRRIAFLGYDKFAHIYYSYSYKRKFAAEKNLPGTVPLELDIMLQDINKAKEKADIIVISLHWGIEESNNITKEQRKLAHNLIDAGADIILGHHPHVIQPIEIYKERPIIYSMGNYIFDQNDENNKQSMMVNIICRNGSIDAVEAIPLYVQAKSEPIKPSGEKGRYIKNKIYKLSKKLNTEGKIKENKVIFSIER